jgi:hypothetical protein
MAEFIDFLRLYYAQLAAQHAASESADLFSVSASVSSRSFAPRRSQEEAAVLCVSLLDAPAIE